MHGKNPVTLDTGKPEEVEAFVSGLGEALTKDMSEIRETELDQVIAGYVDVQLKFKDGHVDDAYLAIDRLGRLIVPVDPQWDDLVTVVLIDKENSLSSPRAVIRHETRYQGEEPCSQVIYLEKE